MLWYSRCDIATKLMRQERLQLSLLAIMGQRGQRSLWNEVGKALRNAFREREESQTPGEWRSGAS